MDMSNQRAAEIVQLYFETHSSKAVIRIMRKSYPLGTKLTKLQVNRLVKKFQKTGLRENARLKDI